ncbi:MAG: hypothetical protein JWO73_324 [Candidatus Taylorbacteria bacterium]|nr:hypothetical protein [Candidatus Taylorbacteria bacterium]
MTYVLLLDYMPSECYNSAMEMQMDMKGLDKACACKSDKVAGACCKKDEKCPCGSNEKVSKCCVERMTETAQSSNA